MIKMTTHLVDNAPKSTKIIEVRGKIAPLLNTAETLVYIGNDTFETAFSKEQITFILEGLKMLQDANMPTITYIDIGEEHLLKAVSLSNLQAMLEALQAESSSTFENDKHGSHWQLLQHSIAAVESEIASKESEGE